MKRITGAVGSYPEYYTAVNEKPPVLAVFQNEKRMKLFLHDVQVYGRFFKKDIQAVEFPAVENKADTEAVIKRNFVLYALLTGKPIVVGTTRKTFKTYIPDPKQLKENIITVKTGTEVPFEQLTKKLIELGYIRVDSVENDGEFSVKGGFITVQVPFSGQYQLDFFGDTVEQIYEKSLLGTKKKVQQVEIFPLTEDYTKNYLPAQELFKKLKKIYLDIQPDDENSIYFITAGSNPDIGSQKEGKLFKQVKLPLRQSLVLKKEKTSFTPDREEVFQFEYEPINEGDYIIHEDYGIGIYRGIQTRQIKGKTYDFMILEYAGGEKIYVSYLHFGKIFRYKAEGKIQLDTIGGSSWRNLKRKVKNSLKKVAKELIKLYAERQSIKRKPFTVDDELIKEFEDSFPFVETPDQLKAVQDVKKDMSSDRPMERVVCGDVGFGKTEVALRATFISVFNGKQVAVLTPTTVLSFQHYKNFKKRLHPFGIKVENLSRLKSKKEIQQILEKLKNGEIDVVIGTHRLLQDDVEFKDLGLLVIDEEHRFGVRAKEKIRQLKKDVDTLYLTATPIPRTLNMALSGLKDMSVIRTPPEGRVETKTFVSMYDEELIKKAVQFELERGGQVFYLHNRVETINKKAESLQKLFPDIKVLTAHGKMKPKEIENVILQFMEGKAHILVATSIIETGIDIPTANTLIIENAENFGLAQLYHLRGRVGRGNIQAYCYLLTSGELSEKAEKRIDAVMRLTRPGSGLKISLEDMKIRGVGNLLGVEQSGHIKAVGYQMYLKLLQEVINEEKGVEEKPVRVDVKVDSFIPEDFIHSPEDRMKLYMSISKAEDLQDIDQIEKYLSEFYSGLPEAFSVYLSIEKLKRAVKGKGIEKIEINKNFTVLQFDTENPPEPETIKKIFDRMPVLKTDGSSVQLGLKPSQLEQLIQIFTEKTATQLSPV
ncbi:transcription-repair coupling factor [Persephonella sp.]